MNRNTHFQLAVAAVGLSSTLVLTGCAPTAVIDATTASTTASTGRKAGAAYDQSGEMNRSNNYGRGRGAMNQRQQGSGAWANQVITPATKQEGLSAADADSLAFMREEEKLARDVYTALAAEWKLPIFSNIARSEQKHMDEIAVLLQRYGIDDPAAGNAPGKFENPELQRLYDSLLAQGVMSQTDALHVGVLIEETDIADLNARRTAQSDIQKVYDNLTRGSQNHLRAFNAQL